MRGDDWELILAHTTSTCAARPRRRRQAVFRPRRSALLRHYDWPGNVREVKALADTGFCLSDGRADRAAATSSRRWRTRRAHCSSSSCRSPTRHAQVPSSLVNGEGSFWDVVYQPYMDRELARADVRAIVARGLTAARGSYKRMLTLFGLADGGLPALHGLPSPSSAQAGPVGSGAAGRARARLDGGPPPGAVCDRSSQRTMRPDGRGSMPMHHRYAFVLVLALMTVSSGVRTAETADELLALHVKWLGGREAIARLRDLRWQGTATIAGLDGTIELVETRNGWRRCQSDVGPIVRTDVDRTRGRLVAQPQRTGRAVECRRRVETERQDNLRTFGRHLLQRTGIDVGDMGREDKEGRSWRVLRFTFPNGDGFDLFVDPADGSCTWIRERQDTDVFWTRLGDWRLVSAVRLPFQQESIHEDNPRRNSTVRWTTVAANAGVSRTVFARPAPTSGTARIATAGGSTPRMPLQLVQRRWMMLDGKVEGVDATLLLDTGAQNTVLSATFAARAGLSGAGTAERRGNEYVRSGLVGARRWTSRSHR